MTIKKPLDLATGLFLLSGAIFMFNQSFAIRQARQIALGPTFFPRILLGVIIVLAVIMIFQSFGKGTRTKTLSVEELAMEKQGYILQWAFMGSLFLYIALMPVLSYLPATFLFCFCAMALLGKRTKKDLLIYAGASALTACGLMYIFGTLLSLFLP